VRRSGKTVRKYEDGSYVAAVLQGPVLETDILSLTDHDIWRKIDGPEVDEPWMHPHMDRVPTDKFMFKSLADLKANRKTDITDHMYGQYPPSGKNKFIGRLPYYKHIPIVYMVDLDLNGQSDVTVACENKNYDTMVVCWKLPQWFARTLADNNSFETDPLLKAMLGRMRDHLINCISKV
jgi:hypothetical protein